MRARIGWLSGAIVGVGVLTATSRRWSAVLMASALGMGLFIGVAFGPAIDRIGAIGGEVVALDSGTSAAQPASAVDDEPAASSPDDDSYDSTTPSDTAPAPYIPPAPAPYIPPTEAPPAVPPADETPPGDDPGDQDGASFAGTVVHVNPPASSYTLAVRGELYAVHARDLPDPGEKVEVALAELANGTYEEDGERSEEGEAEAGSVNGFVTWVRDDGQEPAYTVSMRGVSLLVTVPPEDETELPELGEFVSAQVAIEDPPSEEEVQRLRRRARLLAPAPPPAQPALDADGGCERSEPARLVAPRATLVQRSVEPSGDTYDYFDVAGLVQAACPEDGKLVLSADDIRASEADIVLAAPKGLEIAGLEADEPVLATAEVGEEGQLTLAGLAGDEGAEGADDEGQLQGDLGG